MLINYNEISQNILTDLDTFKSGVNAELDDIPFRADRWVLSSALQKAVRRGHIQNALKAAFMLKKVDTEKLWRRLSVLQMEDLSTTVANQAYQVLWTAHHPSWRRKCKKENDLIKMFVIRSCQSAKSRVANDLIAIANRHPAFKSAADDMSRMDFSALADIYLNDEMDIIHRAIAAWYLCGVYPRRLHNMKPRSGDWRAFLDLHSSHDYPEDVLKLMRRGFSGGEGHSRTYGLAWKHRHQKSHNIFLKNEIKGESPIFGGFPSEVYDIHTAIGKTAYKNITRQENALSAFIRRHLPESDHLRLLGMTIFALEGNSLHAREGHSGTGVLLNTAIDAYVFLYGLQGAIKEDFFALVSQKFSLIHEERENACRFAGLIA